jgi:polynucleotide 5'-hydroxyl-kinase GRC3/NOL9
VGEARREAALVLIDTTGLVTGELGLGLKLAKIRATGADRVIAVQREKECEPILERLGNVAIHRLCPSPLTKSRSPEARGGRRKERLSSYFAAASTEFIIRTGQADFFRFGREVSLRSAVVEEGTVIGLNHGAETIALGIVTEADRNGISFRAPLRSVRGINRVVLGEMSL